jgi:hypothetical protein
MRGLSITKHLASVPRGPRVQLRVSEAIWSDDHGNKYPQIVIGSWRCLEGGEWQLMYGGARLHPRELRSVIEALRLAMGEP